MYLSLDRKKLIPHSSFAITNSPNIKLDVKKEDVNKDPKEKRFDSMKSNIFNSERKGKENVKSTQSLHSDSKNKQENSNNVVPKKINKSNISTAFDWTYRNTESVINESSQNIKEPDFPAKMKRKNLVSEFDEKAVKNYNMDINKTKTQDEKEIQKKEISDLMKQKYGTNVSRMKRNFDSVSSLNNHESYINILKSMK